MVALSFVKRETRNYDRVSNNGGSAFGRSPKSCGKMERVSLPRVVAIRQLRTMLFNWKLLPIWSSLNSSHRIRACPTNWYLSYLKAAALCRVIDNNVLKELKLEEKSYELLKKLVLKHVDINIVTKMERRRVLATVTRHGSDGEILASIILSSFISSTDNIIYASIKCKEKRKANVGRRP